MAVYLVKGARDNVLGNISDAGPFRIFLNTDGTSDELPAQQAGTLAGFLVHDYYDDTDSKLEDITVDGVTFTNVVSKDSLNAGIGLTTNATGPRFIFRSVSNCINGFTYIPPSPTPTATVTPSATPSVTPSTSATPSVTPSVTATVTPTVSVTPTISVTTSVTPTATVSTSVTPSISISPSKTPSISITPTISITPSISTTPGVSPTPSTTPPNSPPNSPPAAATSNGAVTFSGVSRSSSGTITGTVNVSMTSYSVNSHVHVDIYAYGNGGSASQGSVYYVGNASSVPSNPSDTFSVSDSDWADYANGGGTVTVRAILYLNSEQQDIEYTYLTVPAAPATPSPTPTISDTPSVSVTPTVSVTLSPTKTPPASPPPARTQDTVFGAGQYSCNAACNDYSSTSVWFNGGSIGTGTTLYTSSTGYGTLSTGYFSFYDGVDECWYYSGGAYYQSECCVMEGTMISISSGSSVAVETLSVGDEVMSKNIPSLPDSDEGLSALHSWNSDNINGSSSTAIVTGNSTEVIRGIYNFNNGALYTTHSHSHIIKRNGIWKILKASEVLSGDIYEDVNGDEIEITSIVVEDRDVRIYKLNVETDDVYYANGILTHNYK